MRSPRKCAWHELPYFDQCRFPFGAKYKQKITSAKNIVDKTRALSILVLVNYIDL